MYRFGTDLHRLGVVLGRKTKLEQAVEQRTADMNEAQRAIVLAQLAEYRRNKSRLSEIADRLYALNAIPAATRDEIRLKQTERSALAYEHNQLSIANSRISADLFGILGDEEGK